MNKLFETLKKNRRAITNILTVAIFALIAVYLYNNRGVFENLKNIEISLILLIIFFQILTVFSDAFINQRIINILEKNLSFKESLLLQYSNNFINKIFSKGGAIFRGYYLKSFFNLPYSKYISTLAGLYIIAFLVYSFLGLISLAIIYSRIGVYNLVVTFFFIGFFCVTLFLMLTKSKLKINRETRLGNIVGNLIDGWEQIRKEPRELIIIFVVKLILLSLTVILNILIYKSLGVGLGIVESVYMSTISIMTLFINLTPAGIGIKEGIYMFSSQLISMDPDIILLGSLVGRAIVLIPSVVLGGLSYLILTKKLKKKVLQKDKLKNLKQ
jgi:uncharacterized protein (TIRG00374 family)